MNKKTKITVSTQKAKTRNRKRNLFSRQKNYSLDKPSSTSVVSANHSKPDRDRGNQHNRSSVTKSKLLPNIISLNNFSSKRHRQHKIQNQSKPKPVYTSLLLASHLIAVVVGISTILGTVISVANSFDMAVSTKSQHQAVIKPQSTKTQQLETMFPVATLGTEILDLKAKLANLSAQYPSIKPAIFLVDLDNQDYVSINAKTPISAASTIKLPILVALLQEVDAGKIRLEETLIMTEDVIGGGSGSMQYEKPGTQFTILETATKMMTISDNTATNMLIERMGGMNALNQKFMDWGLAATRIRNPLPDLTGTNTTSPEDLGNLLAQVETGEILSLRSRDRLLYIMRNIVRNTLLPEGLEQDAIIAHKTGDIKSVLGDVGIIDMPNGKRYIAAVLVKRPDNDLQAKTFIQKMSKVSYQHFK